MSSNRYKNLKMIRENVKIYKYQNKMSAIDLSHILNSYRSKGDGDNEEYIYSGRICFSISSGGTYQKAYLTKMKAKAIFQTVINGTFTKYYPSGFQDFGGGQKDGKIFSNKLEIKITNWNGRNKVAFNIEEMPGKRTPTGAYKPIGKPYLKTSSMLDLGDFLEMAIEGLDFIRAAEIIGMQQGKPLHTLTSVSREKIGVINEDNQGRTTSNNQNNINQIITDRTLDSLEGREFHNYYLNLQHHFNKAQEEYDRRVAASNKNKQQN